MTGESSFSCRSVYQPSFFTTSAERCAYSASFGTPSALNVDLAVFVFFFNLSCAQMSPGGLVSHVSW